MIKIVCHMKVKADSIETFKSAAKEIVEKSQAEAGNISYTLNQSINDAQDFAMIEIWKDQAAIDEHNASEHFTRILPQLGVLCESSPSIYLYNEVEF